MGEYFESDPAASAPCICDCCGWNVESAQGCQCPECPTCGEQGNPHCYESSQNADGSSNPEGHNMDYNEIQQCGQYKRQEMDREDREREAARFKEQQ